MPPGFVHVDLDGIWTLAGVYGFPERGLFDQDVVFAKGVERLLKLFDGFNIRATFFVIGRDIESPAKAEFIRAIVAAGHALANHSYSHRIDLELIDDVPLRHEIEKTNALIESIAGKYPFGFRSPGYAAGGRVLEACGRAGLRYDGSCLPTAWGGVLRRLANGLRRKVQREERLPSKDIPGSGLQYGGEPMRGGPFAPEVWQGEAGRLLRLPLAVSPALRLPLHASLGLMMGPDAVRMGIRRLAQKGEPLTYLLHGLDVIGAEDLPAGLPRVLKQQKSFAKNADEKLLFLEKVLGQFKASTALTTTEAWLQAGGARRWLDK